MPLKPDQIESITRQVYQKFPELKGTSPEVQSQAAPGAKSIPTANHYLVIFKSRGRPAGYGAPSPNIIRVVRVTADAKGHVLKMSTSR